MKRLITLLALTAGLLSAQTITTTNNMNSVIASAAHSGTLFMAIVGGASNATEANVQSLAGQTMTINNLYANTTVAPAGSNTIIVTVDKNGVATAVTCTITGPATACNDTTHSFTTVPTDLLSISTVYSTAVTSAFTTSVQEQGTAVGVTLNNHTLYTGSAPTLSACGTSPTNTNATDNAGTVTLGTGTVNACTMTFATAFTNTPACTVTSNSNVPQPWASSISTTAVTFSFPYTGATKFSYTCF